MIGSFWDETEDREEREDEQRTLLALKTTLKSFAIIANFCSIDIDAPLCNVSLSLLKATAAWLAVRFDSRIEMFFVRPVDANEHDRFVYASHVLIFLFCLGHNEKASSGSRDRNAY